MDSAIGGSWGRGLCRTGDHFDSMLRCQDRCRMVKMGSFPLGENILYFRIGEANKIGMILRGGAERSLYIPWGGYEVASSFALGEGGAGNGWGP